MTGPDFEPVVLGAAVLRKGATAIVGEDLAGDASPPGQPLQVVRSRRPSAGALQVSSVMPPAAADRHSSLTDAASAAHTCSCSSTHGRSSPNQALASAVAYLLAHANQPNNGRISEAFKSAPDRNRSDLAALRVAYAMPSDGLETTLRVRLGELADLDPIRTTAVRDRPRDVRALQRVGASS